MIRRFGLILATTALFGDPAIAQKVVPDDLGLVTSDVWHGRLVDANANCTNCHAEPRDAPYRKWVASHAQADTNLGWHTLNWVGGSDDLGAKLTPVDDALRVQLGLPEGRGLVVTGVSAEGRAAKAGLKANDILLTLDEKPLVNPKDLLGHLKNASVTHPEKTQLPLTLLRAGKPMTIQVKPEVRVALGTVVVPKPEYYLGLPSNPIDETLRTHLGLPEGQGLIVSAEPDANTPAAKAGIKKNDILLSFDGQPMTNTEVLRARIQVVGSKPTKADLVRAGKRIELLLTPEPRKPEPETNLHGEFLQQYYRSLLDNDTVPVLNDVPVLGRLYRADQLQIPINNVAPTASSPSPELTKKIDDLSAQVQALRKAIEELKTQAKPGESK